MTYSESKSSDFSLLHFLDAHAGALQALSSFLIVALTLAYIFYSRALALEAIATRRAQDNPYLLISLGSGNERILRDGNNSAPAQIDVIMTNGGRGPARSISIVIENSGHRYETANFAFLSPGESIRVALQLRAHSEVDINTECLDVVVSYDDMYDATWYSKSTISWSPSDVGDSLQGLDLNQDTFLVERPSKR